jgi:lipopolysaccharide cholinephosphotransferase
MDGWESSDIANTLNYVVDLTKVTIDITKIPQAKGNLKVVQNCSISVLSVFSEIAEKHNLKWWIDSGTLIGHVRHDGFIPWDDDIDIAMMRDDYERMFTILDKEFCKDGFFYTRGEITRLFYKNTPAQVDIFPIDIGYQTTPLVGNEHDSFIKSLNAIKDNVHFNYELFQKQIAPVSIEEIKNALAMRDEILVKNPVKNGFLFYGVEALVKNRCIFSFDDVFPLIKAEFYGIKTHIPNNWNYWLFMQYGDFMKFPQDCFPKHAEIMGRLTPDNYKECQNLISVYYPKKAENG